MWFPKAIAIEKIKNQPNFCKPKQKSWEHRTLYNKKWVLSTMKI
jgi:hypothetical protein